MWWIDCGAVHRARAEKLQGARRQPEPSTRSLTWQVTPNAGGAVPCAGLVHAGDEQDATGLAVAPIDVEHGEMSDEHGQLSAEAIGRDERDSVLALSASSMYEEGFGKVRGGDRRGS